MNDIVLIVTSCDKYKSLQEPFFKIFKKYWPDCPFEVRLILLNSGNWAREIKEALEKIEAPYFFRMSDDSLLSEKVDTEKILELFEIVKKENICFLGLSLFPRYDIDFPQFKNYPDLIEINNDPYRVNLRPGIWNKEVFVKILKDGETMWEMEIEGTKRSGEFKPFVVVKKPVLNFIESSADGKITKEAVEHLKKEGFDFSSDTVFAKFSKYPHRV